MNTNNDLQRLQHPEAAPVIKANAKAALNHASPNTEASNKQTEATKPSPKAKPKAAPVNTTSGGYSVSNKGVWFKSDEDDAGQWVCARLDILARTRDDNSGNWGLLVAFSDPDGKPKEINLASAALTSEGGGDTVRVLADQGLQIASGLKGKQRLLDYLQRAAPIERATLVDKAGWHGNAFLLGEEAIGDTAERLVFLSSGRAPAPYAQAGSLSEWRQGIASLCEGNPRMQFAVSMAFAAPLLELTGTESGGFHMVGESSKGKSTLMQVAASVWGEHRDYCKTWRTTDNALEGIARAYSDCLLPLDELKESPAHVIDQAIYMLGNGKAKSRATDSGGLRKTSTWRVLFLSAGELTLQQHLASVGKQTFAGLEMRLLSIPTDGEMFSNLHQIGDGAAFSNHMKAITTRFYGTAGRAFLHELVKQRGNIAKEIKASQDAFLASHMPPGSHGQIDRAARRFALVGVAGELATRWGITGWAEGAALSAAAESFNAWLAIRGTSGSLEEREILHRLAAFIEQHGEARFTRLTDEKTSDADNHKGKTLARCGYRHMRKGPLDDNPAPGFTVNGEGDAVHVTYYVFAHAWSDEIFKGLSVRLVNRVLIQYGVLLTGKDGKSSRTDKAVGLHKVECPGRVYVVDGDMLSVVNGGQD